MTAAKLKRKLGLAESDFDRIKEAVQKVERNTTGEVALAATGESSDYSFPELLWAVIFGAIAFASLLPAHAPIAAFLDRLTWESRGWHLPAFYGVVSFAVIGAFFLIANLPAIDRLIVPPLVRSKAVYRRALRYFVESGTYATADRTGILIFISWMEREVRIVADSGISAKIAQSEWDAIARTVSDGIKRGAVADALVAAIADCGELLAAHFPAKRENPNELADALVILEGEE